MKNFVLEFSTQLHSLLTIIFILFSHIYFPLNIFIIITLVLIVDEENNFIE